MIAMLVAEGHQIGCGNSSGATAHARTLRVGLYCDREDWILGTIARQIRRVLEPSGLFDFVIGSWRHFLESPVSQIREFRHCDIIHWLTPHGYLELGKLFPGSRDICTIHHCLPDDGIWPGTFRNTKVLTVSKLSRQALEARGFQGVEIIHDGVDPDLFAPLGQEYCRRLLDVGFGIPLIGFFGKGSSNPQDRKGAEVLVSVASVLASKREVGFLLSGEGWEALACQLESVGARVWQRRVDSLDEMPLLYGAIDVYLCTSRIEGGPVPVLEAMACERPVVSTPVGHVPEVIQAWGEWVACPH